jgi:hypothetical protein
MVLLNSFTGTLEQQWDEVQAALSTRIARCSYARGGSGLSDSLEEHSIRYGEDDPGYAVELPGKTGTPPGTSASTIFTLAVMSCWSAPSWTTLVPETRSVMGTVTA